MTESNITPPPELVQLWFDQGTEQVEQSAHAYIATRAAQWGADQELEACCDWLAGWCRGEYPGGIGNLRIARRPKPPSLKEQALEALESLQQRTTDPSIIEPLRRALEKLSDEMPEV